MISSISSSKVGFSMQILGLSESTPRSEGRLKALLWPSIRNDGDFDYITEQGFWVCFSVATITLIFSFFTNSAWFGLFEFVFYFLAGVGVRQRDKLSAIAAFTAYLLGAFVLQRFTGNGFGVIRLIFLALLLSNVRAIWISSGWKQTADSVTEPIRLNQTLFDKLSDQLPGRIWPKAKWVFAFFAAVEIALELMALTMPLPPARLQ